MFSDEDEPVSFHESAHLLAIEQMMFAGSWTRTPDGLTLSPNLFALFDVDVDSLGVSRAISEGVLPKLDPKDRPSVFAFIEGLPTAARSTTNFRAVIADEAHFFEASAINVGDSRYGLVRDVTKSTLARRENERFFEDFRTLAEHLPVGIYRGRYDGEMTYANPHLRKLLDIEDLEDLSQFSWHDVLHPEDVPFLGDHFAHFVQTGESFPHQFRLVVNGRVHVVESAISRSGADVDECVCYIIDRTAADSRATRLAESERELKWSQRIGKTGSWHVRFESGPNEPATVYWSDELYHLLGRDPVEFEVTPESFFQHVADESAEETEKVVADAMEQKAQWDYILVMHTSTGRKKWMRSVGEPVSNEQGDVVELRGVIQDVSEMRELEDRVRRAEKMQALGELAGGVAHDFNNMLAAILGNAEILSSELEGEALLDCREIIETARRCGDLTNQLLAFSRRSPLTSNEIDIAQSVESVLGLIKHAVVANIETIIDMPPAPPLVAGEAGQIDNALLNIALNSIQAMRGGGTLQIEIEHTVLDPADWSDEFEVIPGPAVSIAISDTGRGIEPELLSRVIEPFFTTRRQKGGTGLGLSTAYGTVRNHGGAMTIESEPGVGTRVKMVLPAAVEPAKPTAEETFDHSTFVGLSALVVDDELSVRRVVSRHLASLGVEVDSAGGHREAVELIRRRMAKDDRYDLGIFDLSMPDGLGTDTSEIFRMSWPESPSLIISGFDMSVALEPGHGEAVLQKPFTATTLAHTLGKLLGRSES